jgi:hypothetical protein
MKLCRKRTEIIEFFVQYSDEPIPLFDESPVLEFVDDLFDKYSESEGKDYLNYTLKDPSDKFDWVVTNPPWSLIRPFLKKSMEISDNVVFLCLINAFFMKARLRDMKSYKFGIKEILAVETPKKPWPQTGFQLGAVHIQKDYVGQITFLTQTENSV